MISVRLISWSSATEPDRGGIRGSGPGQRTLLRAPSGVAVGRGDERVEKVRLSHRFPRFGRKRLFHGSPDAPAGDSKTKPVPARSASSAMRPANCAPSIPGMNSSITRRQTGPRHGPPAVVWSCRRPVFHRVRCTPPCFQVRLDDFARHGVIVHDQYAQALQAMRAFLQARIGRALLDYAEREPEG